MKKKIIFPTTAFFAIFAFHAIYSIHKDLRWMQIDNTQWLNLYLTQQNYFLGVSYALAGAFTVYALLKSLEKCRAGAAGVISGITMTGIIYWGGCFFLGCCGSPMLMVYLGLLGPSFLGFTKPLVLILTLITVIMAYFWIEKRSKTVNCRYPAKSVEKCCDSNEQKTAR